MRLVKRSDIEEPLRQPSGEIVYELIGASPGLGGTASHSVAEIVIPPGKSSLCHHHNVAEETFYMLRGKASLRIDDKELDLSPGQACLIEPTEVHQILNTGTDDLVFLAVSAPPWVSEDSVYAE
jgi:mannose-6-phosphate isomerase-like protein (cupin superfamily)